MRIPDVTWPQVTLAVACLSLVAFFLHLLFKAGHDPLDVVNHPFVLTAILSLFGIARVGQMRGG